MPSPSKHVISIGNAEGAGKPVQKARGPTILLMFLSLSVVSLPVDLQINPFKPNPSPSATESRPFQFSVEIF
jgi:hypothetical protein